MSEINSNNLESHYSSSPKTTRIRKIAEAPASIPSQNLCTDAEMNERLNSINVDIYERTDKNKKKPIRNFIGCFIATIISLLGIRQIYRILRK